MASKDQEHRATGAGDHAETPPAYETVNNSPPDIVPSNPPPSDPASIHAKGSDQNAGPSTEAPFNFPTDVPPSYFAGSSSSSRQPIAIPQWTPSPTSPFVPAYTPVLLNYGITRETWESFLETLSAFLQAKVSDRAISHAGDIARQLGEGPSTLVKDVASHVKTVGQNVSANAKRGNIFGAAMGVVGGAISIPISAALGTVRTVVQLPSYTVVALAKKPKTPYQRAEAYLAVANRDWFEPRGLHAKLFDTEELCQAIDVSTLVALGPAGQNKPADVEGQLAGLKGHIADLEVSKGALSLGESTLWVVLVVIDMK